MKKKYTEDVRKYGSKENPVPQEHWEMKTHLLRGNTTNPYETYFAKTPPEWPHDHKGVNHCDY